MLNRIKSFFRTNYKPGSGEYLELCADTIIKDLNIEKKASAKGTINQPDTNDKVRDDIEHEIISKIQSVAYDAQRRTLDQHSTYKERVKSLNNSGVATEMLAIARRSEANLESEILCVNGELTQARREVIERENTLKNFRVSNGITRPANPEKNKFLLFALLLALFMIETFPSAMLLSGGSELGILGGYTLAISFSFLNLTMGFITGKFAWPCIIHKNKLIKILGVVISCSLVISIVSLNLLLSHFRSIVEIIASTDEASKLAISSFISSPFGLNDISSITMASLGILFSFVSMLEGWLWDEPYLGYGNVTRNLHSAEADYNYLLEDKVAALKNVEISYIEELEHARSSLHDRRYALPRIAQESELLMQKYNAYLLHLQGVGNRILKKYHACNKATRTTPPPSHFDKEWALEGFAIDNLNNIGEFISGAELEKIDKALTDSIEKLQTAYEKAIRGIKALGKSDKLN